MSEVAVGSRVEYSLVVGDLQFCGGSRMFSMLRFFAALFMICHVRGFFRSSTVTKSVRCGLHMAQDVSPARDGGLLKTLLSQGELTSKSPVAGDTVDVSFDVFNAKGEPLYTPEDRSENRFKFVVDGDGEVMYAFHFGVQTMKIGERASFTVGPRYGLSFLKEVITVVLTLHNITPSPTSKLLDPEVIQEDDEVEIDSAPDARSIFLQQLESGESPLIEEVIQNDATLDGSDPRQRQKSVQYFDPAKHKLDPRRKLKGQGADHSWEENVSTLEICFPLPGDITSKKDIVVCIG